MHHLFNTANAVRLTVFLAATVLVVTGMDLSQPPHPQVREAAAPVQVARTGPLGTHESGPVKGPLAVPIEVPATTLRPRPHRAHRQSQAHRAAKRAATYPRASHQRPGRTKHHRAHREKAAKGKRAAHAKHHAKGKHHASAKHHRAKPDARRLASIRADRGARRAPTWGQDISWPQCPRHLGIPDLKGLDLPMPRPGVRFVVVGLTNGRAFTRNPCLGRHLQWIRQHHVWASAYAFATYPTVPQLKRLKHRGPFDGRYFAGKLRNAGYAAAQYNIRTMQRVGLRTPHVWLDVEKSSSRPWSGRADWNRTVVEGWLRAYRDAGYTVGFYSTTSIWQEILGGTKFHLPEWRTAGPDSPRAAHGRCLERSFQGGPGVLAQWWDSHRDYDRMCPGFGTHGTMSRFFHRY